MMGSFRGAAPLHHTLLAGKTQTGITLQTLHHEKFDRGLILDQTPLPGFDIPHPQICTVPELLELVSHKGAKMLVNGIRNRIFVPPVQTIQQGALDDESEPIHATKITPEDRHVQWEKWDREHIIRRNRVLGPLWNNAIVMNESAKEIDDLFQTKRVVLNSIQEIHKNSQFEQFRLLPGVPFTLAKKNPENKENSLYVYSRDLKLLRLCEITVEGEQISDGFRAAKKAQMFSNGTLHLRRGDFHLFHHCLF